MSDGVKFIFKTLIKVPCYIMVAYFILNIFAFAHTYFKMLGFSYVVMQTAVENNYLPDTEYSQLKAYLDKQTTAFCANPTILVSDPADGSIEPAYGSAYSRRQYGSKVAVGVAYDFKMIWPLMTLEADQASTGQSDRGINEWNANAGMETSGQLDSDGDGLWDTGNKGWNRVEIRYTVPGLKYYPDLSS